MNKTAISFKVPPKLWGYFKTQTDELFISRAPFLNHMVKRELTHLREDLEGLKLSPRAKRYISGRLKRTGPKSVNIEVEPETAASLRAAVSAHNLVRDAFMCRLIVFLRGTDALLDYLDVPRVTTSIGRGMSLDGMPTSPLAAMEAVRDDPLYYIRNYLQTERQCGIYRVELFESADWAACYLEDDAVPGTGAHRRKQKESDEFSAALGVPNSSEKSTTRGAKGSRK